MKMISTRPAAGRLKRTTRTLASSLVIVGLALSASASNPEPAAVKTQTTKAKDRHWFQVGIASWYGGRFQGRKTATGEVFDMGLMTCAHRSLPLGTWLRVTNVRTRKSAFVRVNDRGPVLEDRIVDLSFAAAQAVGLSGIGKVKLETVREGDPELAKALVAQLHMPPPVEVAQR